MGNLPASLKASDADSWQQCHGLHMTLGFRFSDLSYLEECDPKINKGFNIFVFYIWEFGSYGNRIWGKTCQVNLMTLEKLQTL